MPNINVPLLFIVFNRPNTTKKVFERIREAKPRRLYVAADGPRSNEEKVICEKVRKIATNVDWDCEVKTLFQEENIGCGPGPVTGITWFFENEEYGVILEDDCVPEPTFFEFCEELLVKYRDDERIMHINGNNYGADKGNFYHSEYSYHFGNMPQAWGWASWRRAWQNFNWEINNLTELVESDYLNILLPKKKQRSQQIKRWKQVVGGKRDIWDYQWQFSVISNHGLTIVPKVNQISNIGFGKDATHTKNSGSYKDTLNTEVIDFPLNHPQLVFPDSNIDQWYKTNMVGEHALYKHILRKIKILLGYGKV